MSYLVIGQFRWGHAEDLIKAKRNFRNHGGTLANGYTIVEFPKPLEFQGLNQMGSYHWLKHGSDTEPIVTEVQPRKRKA